jgi:hypothetical protein
MFHALTNDNSFVTTAVDPLLVLMIKSDVPLTRENYLTLMFMGDPPEWSPEYEDEIPAFLQDWESESFGAHKTDTPTPSNLGRKGFHSLTLEELEELGKVT